MYRYMYVYNNSHLQAVLEIIFIDCMVKCHLCLVTLTGHMQECMVILIKRPVNDRGGSEKFLTLTCIQCIEYAEN